MSVISVVLADLLAVLAILWMMQLVRMDRMYVGYAVAFVIVTAIGALAISIPPLLAPLQVLTGVEDRSALALGLTLAFVLLILIYVLSQLTILANRLTLLTQEIAIREASGRASIRETSAVHK